MVVVGGGGVGRGMLQIRHAVRSGSLSTRERERERESYKLYRDARIDRQRDERIRHFNLFFTRMQQQQQKRGKRGWGVGGERERERERERDDRSLVFSIYFEKGRGGGGVQSLICQNLRKVCMCARLLVCVCVCKCVLGKFCIPTEMAKTPLPLCGPIRRGPGSAVLKELITTSFRVTVKAKRRAMECV